MGEDPDEVALRGDLDGVELALDRLHGHDVNHAAETVDGGGAHHRRLRKLVEHQRDEARLADRLVAQGGGEGLAVNPEILDPDAMVADEQAPGRLGGKLHPPVRVDRQERRGRVVEHSLAETVRFGEPQPLVAKASNPLVKRLADVGKAASVGAVGETL